MYQTCKILYIELTKYFNINKNCCIWIYLFQEAGPGLYNDIYKEFVPGVSLVNSIADGLDQVSNSSSDCGIFYLVLYGLKLLSLITNIKKYKIIVYMKISAELFS